MMKAGLLAATLLFTALGGAHGATCGNNGGGPVTDAECGAWNTGYVYDDSYYVATHTCTNDPCSGSDLYMCCKDGSTSNDDNWNTNTGLGGDECDSSKTWYKMVTTFSYVGALIAIVGIGA